MGDKDRGEKETLSWMNYLLKTVIKALLKEAKIRIKKNVWRLTTNISAAKIKLELQIISE